MNVVNVVKLNEWIETNQDRLSIGQRGTLAELASAASTSLGFKVTSGALSQLMRNRGIPTKRVSKADAEKLAVLVENERFRAEIKKLKKIMAMVAASASIDENLREIIFENLDEEMKEAILAKL